MLWQRREFLHCLALRSFLLPQFLAGLGLAVEGLCHSSRTAHLAQMQNLYVKLAALIANAQHVSDANVPRRFCLDLV